MAAYARKLAPGVTAEDAARMQREVAARIQADAEARAREAAREAEDRARLAKIRRLEEEAEAERELQAKVSDIRARFENVSPILRENPGDPAVLRERVHAFEVFAETESFECKQDELAMKRLHQELEEDVRRHERVTYCFDEYKNQQAESVTPVNHSCYPDESIVFREYLQSSNLDKRSQYIAETFVKSAIDKRVAAVRQTCSALRDRFDSYIEKTRGAAESEAIHSRSRLQYLGEFKEAIALSSELDAEAFRILAFEVEFEALEAERYETLSDMFCQFREAQRAAHASEAPSAYIAETRLFDRFLSEVEVPSIMDRTAAARLRDVIHSRALRLSENLDALHDSFESYCEQAGLGQNVAKLAVGELGMAFERFSSERTIASEDEREAFLRFRADIAQRVTEAKSKNVLATIAGAVKQATRFAFGKLKSLFSKTTFDTLPGAVTATVRDKCLRQCRLARTRWSCAIPENDQATISIHRVQEDGTDAPATLIQIMSAAGKQVFIKIDSHLDPVELARRYLKALAKGLRNVVHLGDPLAVFDGDYQALNMKDIFRDRVVLRSASDDDAPIASRIDRLYRSPALSQETTAIVGGYPGTEHQLKTVGINEAEWSNWRGVSKQWKADASAVNLETQEGSRDAFLKAMLSKSNVIVLLAHGDSQALYFPDPAPQGSVVRIEDLDEVADQIRANSPTIYMYSCKASQVSDMENWAGALLNAGAAAVFAPQSYLPVVGRPRKLFRKFVQFGRRSVPVKALHEAERSSKCRLLEGWVG